MGKLQLSSTPDLATPARFFLTAPLFGLAAVGLLAGSGVEATAVRWTPALLAVTHLLTLGFMATVMVGALFQVLPVVLGVCIPAGRPLGRVVHGGLTLGCVLLVVGLLVPGHPLPLWMGLGALALTFAGFLGAAAMALRAPVRDARGTLSGVRLALVALLVTLMLGLLLGLSHAGIADGSLDRRWTNLHALWGVLGWVGLLVVSVAYEVVPMLQLTPPYPSRIKHWLVPVLFAALCLTTLGLVGAQMDGGPLWRVIAWSGGSVLGSGLLLFAALTLYLQTRRKKPEPDVTVGFWRFGMFNLAAGISITVLSVELPEVASGPWLSCGASLVLVGFALSVINGMLYKIVPFLVWLHLTLVAQTERRSRQEVPGVKRVLAVMRATPQLVLHASGTLLIALFFLWPSPLFLWAAVLSLGVSFGLLEWNLVAGLRLFLQVRKTLRAGAPAA